uniref:Uncharacterized protein n=1 Tax=Anguilla anguilla TaxID=7936 RepID=A0A0E9UJV3_ANGAN
MKIDPRKLLFMRWEKRVLLCQSTIKAYAIYKNKIYL